MAAGTDLADVPTISPDIPRTYFASFPFSIFAIRSSSGLEDRPNERPGGDADDERPLRVGFGLE